MLTGPTTVTSGATNTYTLTVSGGQRAGGGLDVAASAGNFAIIDAMTKLLNGEVTHNAPKNAVPALTAPAFGARGWGRQVPLSRLSG
ncbi:MAG: choice-of-anchor V domain-containing protein [Terriglobales bacterium]